jgi:hypothetical protein
MEMAPKTLGKPQGRCWWQECFASLASLRGLGATSIITSVDVVERPRIPLENLRPDAPGAAGLSAMFNMIDPAARACV